MENFCSVFPIEIVEGILMNLDGVSLVKASSVCKIWRDVYLNLIQRNFFETLCKRDIAPDSLLDVIDKLYPEYPIKKIGTVNWFRVYKCWYWWNKVSEWTPSANALIDHYDSRISSMKVSGEWVIYGTIGEGKVNAYSLKTGSLVNLYEGHGIVDIDLFNVPNYVRENFDGDTVHHDGFQFYLENRCIMFINFHDHLAVNAELKYNSAGLRRMCAVLEWLLFVKTNLNLKMVSLGLPNETANEEWMKMIRGCYRTFTSPFNDVTLSHEPSRELSIINIHQWYQLQRNVAFGFSFSTVHMIVFVVDNNIKIYRPPGQMFAIEAATIHCNTLFLGNEKGTLFVYRLTNLTSLLSLNLSEHALMYHVSDSPICSIDVQYSGDKPFLVVATDSSIYKICEVF